jgi:hypothetical protein
MVFCDILVLLIKIYQSTRTSTLAFREHFLAWQQCLLIKHTRLGKKERLCKDTHLECWPNNASSLQKTPPEISRKEVSVRHHFWRKKLTRFALLMSVLFYPWDKIHLSKVIPFWFWLKLRFLVSILHVAFHSVLCVRSVERAVTSSKWVKNMRAWWKPQIFGQRMFIAMIEFYFLTLRSGAHYLHRRTFCGGFSARAFYVLFAMRKRVFGSVDYLFPFQQKYSFDGRWKFKSQSYSNVGLNRWFNLEFVSKNLNRFCNFWVNGFF